MVDTREQVFTVSQLTKAIKQLLEPNFLSVYVKGEVTNLRLQSSGHVYFSLKDENAQISAVIFKSTYSKLEKPIKIGDKILVQGQLSIYSPRGSYQIIIQKLRHEGLGDLLLKLHELKKNLQEKGYFDEKHKKPLPKFPKTIGVVTSPTGSVIQDIIHVLTRRFKGFHLILNPVRVQGEGSEVEIAKAIDDFNTYKLADVLIVGRGGGSLEDLWAFNEPIVAKAIFQSQIPIVSAVGHETDFSIADLISDIRAPTPSAAAEIVLKEKSAQIEFLNKSSKILKGLLSQIYTHSKLKISSLLKQPIFTSHEAILFPFSQKLDEKISSADQVLINSLNLKKCSLDALEKRLKAYKPNQILSYHTEQKTQFSKNLDRSVFQLLSLSKQRLENLDRSIQAKFLEVFNEQKTKFQYLKKLLFSIDPKNLLKKGYCIPFAENKNSVIISTKQLSMGDSLKLQFFDGEVDTKVLNKKHYDE